MIDVVYFLCTAISLVCAALLLRGYLESRARLLLWCSLCFTGLALNNGLLMIERFGVSDINFAQWRLLAALAAVGVLIFGLIWEGD